MNSNFSLGSNCLDIFKFAPSQTQKISKETSFKFHQSTFSHQILSFHQSSDSIPFFSERSSKHSNHNHPIIPELQNNEKNQKNKRIKKYKCQFPYCDKRFTSQSQLSRHEKSKIAHKKQIFNRVFATCMNSKRLEDLLKDENLKELYKYHPKAFLKVIDFLKKSLNTHKLQLRYS